MKKVIEYLFLLLAKVFDKQLEKFARRCLNERDEARKYGDLLVKKVAKDKNSKAKFFNELLAYQTNGGPVVITNKDLIKIEKDKIKK